MQSSGGFRLVVRRGPQPNQVFELSRDVMTIGREASNEIAVNDPEVSRHHCRLTRSSGGYILEDLGSTNGTFVNGQRLTGARPLSGNDQIGLGETVTLVFEAPGMYASSPGQYADASAGSTMPAGGPPPGGGYYGQQQPSQAPGYGSAPSPGYGAQGAQPGYGEAPAQPGQQPAYGPPQPDYPYQEDYYAEEAGVGRWIFLSCGVFLVLCIITSVIAIILIDQSCAWDDIPILADIVDALGYEVDETAC
ncbi:MAG: FHA domain-containing protein [Chloroflexi bacterium]|nr:FHA domain-containing protein [Chloroflexota bacterium]